MRPHRPTLVTLALVLALPALSSASTLSLGVAAGDVRQTAAVLWGAPNADGLFSFELATDPSFIDLVGTAGFAGTAGTPVKLPVSGLNPGTRHYYRATDAAGHSATGLFNTPHTGGFNPDCPLGRGKARSP